MTIRAIAIFMVLLLSLASYGQQEVFSYEFDGSKAFKTHHVKDNALKRSYLLLVSYNQVDVLILDSAMQLTGKKSYSLGIKEEKYYLTEPLSFTASNGIIYGYYANHDLTILGYMAFNLRGKRARRGQIPIDLNKNDEYLFHYTMGGDFYIASTKEKTSIIKVYQIITPKNIKRKLYKLDVYRNLHAMIKDISAPKAMDIGVVSNSLQNNLNITTKKIKVYPAQNSLTMTFETVLGTEIVRLNLAEETYKDEVLHYRKFRASGLTNNSNSILLNDLHFVARSSGQELLFYIDHPDSTQAVYEIRFTREMDEIPFTNEMENGTTIFTSSRFYRNTPKDFIRAIDDGNIGLDVKEFEDHYLVTIGNFREFTKPLTEPYGSKIAGRNSGDYSYIQTKVSKDFEWIDTPVYSEEDELLDYFFTKNEIKARYVYTFNSEGSKYVSFLDRKTKEYTMYCLD